jgi:HPt (histidine-containing phosphotransfer) domain-containing protein
MAEAAMSFPSEAGIAAIDWAHLDQMTLGDGKLAREVLALFDRQAELLIARMRKADGDALHALAHALKGSARGIGAHAVAEACAELEACAGAGAAACAGALDRLARDVAAARAEIGIILQAN